LKDFIAHELKLLQDPQDTKAALIQLKEEWLHYPGASETTQEFLTQVCEWQDN